MIDTFNDDVISLDQAAAHVAKLSGKKRNRRVILRWINRGLSGVRLPAIRIGSELFTSKQCLNSFLNEAQAARSRQHGKAISAGIRRARLLETEAASIGI